MEIRQKEKEEEISSVKIETERLCFRILGGVGLCLGGLLFLPVVRVALLAFVSRFYKLSPEFWLDKLLIWVVMLTGVSAVALFTATRWFDALAARKKLAEALLNWTGLGLIFLFLAGGICLVKADVSIWGDEACSVFTVRESWTRILSIQTGDVHPPLYFIMLKCFILLFGDTLGMMKFFSTIPVLMTMTAGWMFLKREFSTKSGVLFLLCFFVLLPISDYSTQIRMYTWALFFVTMTVFSMWNAVKTDKTRWWSAVGVFIAISAWTHYYAALAVAVAGGILFFHAVRGGNRKRVYKVLLSGAGGVGLFLPWLPFAISSFSFANHDFWIPPFKLRDAWVCFFLPFRGMTWAMGYQETGFLLLSFCGALIVFFRKCDKRREDIFVFFGVCCWFLAFVISIGIAFFVAPLLTPRYLLPVSILLWLFFAAECPKMLGRRFFVVLCAVFFFVGIKMFDDRLEDSRRSGGGFSRFSMTLTSKITKKDVLVFPYLNSFEAIVSCFLPENDYLCHSPPTWSPQYVRHWRNYETCEIFETPEYKERKAWFFLISQLDENSLTLPKRVEYHGKFEWCSLRTLPQVLHLYCAQESAAAKEMFERIAVMQAEKKAVEKQ
jgi:hypothetical protein